jgi:hypothetical protein
MLHGWALVFVDSAGDLQLTPRVWAFVGELTNARAEEVIWASMMAI